MKKRHIALFWFVPCQLVELFLYKMQRKGWALVKYTLFYFLFEKTERKECGYFVYHSGGGSTKSDGKYDLSLRHWNIPQTYGVSPKKSNLNAYTVKNKFYYWSIIEVSVDRKNDIDYCELIKDRNLLYFKESSRDHILVLIILFLLSYFFRTRTSSIIWIALIIISIIHYLFMLYAYLLTKK